LGGQAVRELKRIRESVRASQKQMAAEMGLSLRGYQCLERGAVRLDNFELRAATFAALRIAIADDKPVDFPLVAIVDELNVLFERLARSHLH
jgi:transcriptional regulator with XRE-family HTH domain